MKHYLYFILLLPLFSCRTMDIKKVEVYYRLDNRLKIGGDVYLIQLYPIEQNTYLSIAYKNSDLISRDSIEIKKKIFKKNSLYKPECEYCSLLSSATIVRLKYIYENGKEKEISRGIPDSEAMKELAKEDRQEIDFIKDFISYIPVIRNL